MTVLVVAKAPRAGRVKTRLAPPLSPRQAAELHTALLLDTLAACRAEHADVALLAGHAAEQAGLAALAPGVPIVLQRGRGLAEALRLGVADHAPAGPVAMVSSDIPGLPPGALRDAFAALEESADVVLGPAFDGGYWLIAMREPHEAPFRDVPWSTPAVWAVTLQRCLDAGLRVHALAPWLDVDTAADLGQLRLEIQPSVAPRTAALLEQLVVSGLVPEPTGVELVGSELLAASPWRAVLRDRLRRHDGPETSYTYLAVPRAVFVVAVTDESEVVLVRQYRHPVRDWTLEVPAGSVDDGEDALAAARRELDEEVGGRSDSWRHLASFYSSSAHLSLRSDAFLATGVTLSQPHPDEDERVVVARLPLADALARARAGGFVEGQTALALLLAEPHLVR